MEAHNAEARLVRYTAKQLASNLLRQIAAAGGASAEDMKRWRMELGNVHFHDASQTEIAFNDVQAIQMYNAIVGDNVPVPDLATEGYNKHYHTSDFDGGMVIGLGVHDHRDVTNGGFAFAAFHPGTSLPQMPWAM